MKNSSIKYHILQIVIVLLYILNILILNIKSTYIFGVILIIILFVSLMISKYEKDKHPYKKEVFQVTSIYLLVYYFLTYLTGFVLGVKKNGFILSSSFILKSIIPIIFIIVIEEIIRYILVTKLSYKKINLLFIIITMIVLDLFILMPNYDYSTLDNTLKLISETILPIISKNILLTYMAYKVGYKINIFYRFILDLFGVYIIPYIPDLGQYLYGIINFISPLILVLYLYGAFKQERFEVVTRGNDKFKNIIYVVVIIMLLPMIYLISNLGKYTAVVIASNSMSPTINKTDVLVYKKTDKCEEIKVGDVLIFSYQNLKLSHRVINIVENGSNKCFIQTKGDNNDSPDAWISTEENIIGLVEYKVPYIGLPTVWLNEMFQKK